MNNLDKLEETAGIIEYIDPSRIKSITKKCILEISKKCG